MARPPKIVIPGLNRGAGIPPGYVLGRLPGTGQGPAQLLGLTALRKVGLATGAGVAQSTSIAISTATSLTASLSSGVSTSISSVVSVNTAQSTSLSQISSSLSGAISTNVGQSTSLSQISSSLSGAISSTSSLSTAISSVDSGQTVSLSQISSSLSGAISSTTSLSTAVSTVISGSISSVNSRIDSLSTAVGTGGGINTVKDEGSSLGSAFTALNFVGGGVTATDGGGGVATVTIPGGDVGQSTSLSQISSSLSSEISTRSSQVTSLSTVISASISSVNSSITSLSTALASKGALVTLSADETTANYSTAHPINFVTETRDTNSIHSYASTVTITIATPGVVSWTAHGLFAGCPVVFTTTGALPTGLTAGTTYYVISAGLAADSFRVSTVAGGSAVNTSGTQSGVHTATNSSRLTVPTGWTQVILKYNILLSAVTANTDTQSQILKNGAGGYSGTSAVAESSSGTSPRWYGETAVLDVTAGDFFDLELGCSDTSITVSANYTWFEMIRAPGS